LCIEDYLKYRHDSLKELLTSVDVRIMVALAQHEDMDEVIAQAEADTAQMTH
jgi:hypothetical protein